MKPDETITDSEPGAENPAHAADSASEPGGESLANPDSAALTSPAEPVTGPPVVGDATAVHWLVRVVERAGLEGERPTIPGETSAKDAWPVVARAYNIKDSRLCEVVASYFRLDVADFKARDPNAPLLVPEVMARRHHVYPLYETDRHLLVVADVVDAQVNQKLFLARLLPAASDQAQ